jgi:hypothetical protein
MSKECYDYSVVPGCYTDGAGIKTSVVIHYYTAFSGQPAARITDTTGTIIVGANATNTTAGACLIDVGEQQVELSDFVLGCALDNDGNAIGPVVLSRRFDEETGIETQTRIMYPYDGTAAIDPYAGPFGLCEKRIETKLMIYLERNSGVVTMADIVATTGSQKVMSVTVKQISGVGSITGDSGSGVPMDAGETWSWSAVSDENSDHLSSSTLSMDAGGGEQRVTATYS